MTEKHLSDGFGYLGESIDDLRMSLYVFMADWMLSIPVGLSYKDWVLLHQIKGDWG